MKSTVDEEGKTPSTGINTSLFIDCPKIINQVNGPIKNLKSKPSSTIGPSSRSTILRAGLSAGGGQKFFWIKTTEMLIWRKKPSSSIVQTDF